MAKEGPQLAADPGQTARERLASRSLRVTRPRVAVLTWLAEHPHSTAEQVSRGTTGMGVRISTQGLYDVLSACCDVGLVRRIEPAGSPARYETRTGDNHHHLVCRRCGRIEDVDCASDDAPCLEPVDRGGFAVDDAEVVFWGVCPACEMYRTSHTHPEEVLA